MRRGPDAGSVADGIALEAYLSKLYTDPHARDLFHINPRAAARAEGVSENDLEALCDIDKAGLQMAADSYAHKREQHRGNKAANGGTTGFYQLLRGWLGWS